MRFKTPLTQDDLRAIQDRNPGSPDTRALLWEIKRLRALVLYMDQLQRMVGTLPGQQGDLLESIRKMLVDEPCVKEFPTLPPDA
jgi:hypothetical protein